MEFNQQKLKLEAIYNCKKHSTFDQETLGIQPTKRTNMRI